MLTLKKWETARDSLPDYVDAATKAQLLAHDERLKETLRPATLAEVTKFLAMLAVTIPRAAPVNDQAIQAQVARDYYDALSDQPFIAFEAVRKKLIREKTFFPSAAEIRQAFRTVQLQAIADRARIFHLLRRPEPPAEGRRDTSSLISRAARTG